MSGRTIRSEEVLILWNEWKLNLELTGREPEPWERELLAHKDITDQNSRFALLLAEWKCKQTEPSD